MKELNTMIARKYVTPSVEVVTVDLKSQILDLSIPIGDDTNYGNIGMTRQEPLSDDGFFEDQSASPSPNLWKE